jgi:hypothetical protein
MRDAALVEAGPNAIDCGATNRDVDAAWRCAVAAYRARESFAITEAGARGAADVALVSSLQLFRLMYSYAPKCPDDAFATEPCVHLTVESPERFDDALPFELRPAVPWLRCVGASTTMMYGQGSDR